MSVIQIPLPWAIFEVCLNALQIGLTLYCGMMLFKPKRHAPRAAYYVILLWVTGTALLSIFTFFTIPVVSDIVPGILVFLILTHRFRQGSFRIKLLLGLIYFVLCGVIALVMRMLVMRVYQVPSEYVTGYNTVRLVYVSLVNLILVVMTFLLIRVSRHIMYRGITQPSGFGILSVFFALPLVSLMLLLGMLDALKIIPIETVPLLHIEGAALSILALNGLLLWVFGDLHKHNESAMISNAEKQRMALQLQRYADIERLNENMQQWEHDYRKHLLTMTTYAERDQIDALRGYLRQQLGACDEITPSVSTGNITMDAVVDGLLAMCRREGIATDVRMRIPARLPVSENDLTIIIGNLLDNAWEACHAVSVDQERFIRIEGRVNGGIMQIQIVNSKSVSEKRRGIRGLTSKRDTSLHGQGQYIVEKLVSNYGGYITFVDGKEIYTANLILELGDGMREVN